MNNLSNSPGSSSELPLVAIITPVYNGDVHLKETMECVQAQTYPRLLHVILDNNSFDSSPNIISSFSHRQIPVLAFRNETTLSQVQNWETALGHMPKEADYFLFLCHDDLISQDAVARLVKIAQMDQSIGVVGCKWLSGPTPNNSTECGGGLPATQTVFDGRWFLKSYLQQCHYATSPQCQLYSRNVLLDRKPFFNHSVEYFDMEVTLYVLLKHNYGFIHAPLGFTRTTAFSRSGATTEPQKLFMKAWLEFINIFGPAVMSPTELEITRRRFLDFYFRRLMLWRLNPRSYALFADHAAWLKTNHSQPRAIDYMTSLLHWSRLALSGQRESVGRPTELWPKTWAELKEWGR